LFFFRKSLLLKAGRNRRPDVFFPAIAKRFQSNNTQKHPKVTHKKLVIRYGMFNFLKDELRQRQRFR